MQDSALDFLVFIIVMGVVVTLGMNLTVPVVKKSKELYYSESYDKTVGKLEGERAVTEADGAMTRDELVLTAIGQNYFIPDPGYLYVCGDTIKVSDNKAFSPNSVNVGLQVLTDLNTWFTQFNSSASKSKFTGAPGDVTQARFRIEFDMNKPDDKADDTYSVYILLKLNKANAKNEIYKCMPNGRVADRKGNVI